jgi:hypothetical protein
VTPLQPASPRRLQRTRTNSKRSRVRQRRLDKVDNRGLLIRPAATTDLRIRKARDSTARPCRCRDTPRHRAREAGEGTHHRLGFLRHDHEGAAAAALEHLVQARLVNHKRQTARALWWTLAAAPHTQPRDQRTIARHVAAVTLLHTRAACCVF